MKIILKYKDYKVLIINLNLDLKKTKFEDETKKLSKYFQYL